MTCKLCGGATEPFGELVVLGRHRARYQRCASCGHVFVEDPYWLDETAARSASATNDGASIPVPFW